MAEVCAFPLCKRVAQSNGYCVGHRIYTGTVIEKSKPKPIPKRSEKMTAAMKELKKLYKIYLQKNPVCKLEMPGCTKTARVIHHSRGREGKQLMNVKDWMPSCLSCNIQVELNDGIARDKGLKKSKHQLK
jgi:hypothetical protein